MNMKVATLGLMASALSVAKASLFEEFTGGEDPLMDELDVSDAGRDPREL